MATNLTTTTFSTTYKDDFRDSDNYHRVLFNAGKALQARELTQMQTIIQREIERFGSNIFREGGIVQPGGVAIVEYEYVKLASGQLPANTATILNKVFTVAAPNPALQVKIVQVIAASGSDPDTLVIEYQSTSAGTSGSQPVRVINGVTLENSVLGPSYDMVVASSAASGRGMKFEVAQGVFFAQGHFVFCEKQEIILSKYGITPTNDIGFRIIQDVVTVSDTNDLYDNQGAAPNLAAPGADRYRIRLVLTTRDQIASGQNFVFLTRVTDGQISDTTTANNSYNVLNDVLALRTKEESGDYIVKPFNAKFNDLNDSNLELEVTDGIVYIDGYRLEMKNKKIVVPKAQQTVTLENQAVVIQYGNYVIGSGGAGLPNINTLQRQNIRSVTGHGGSTIGTCRVRAIEEDGANWRYYLFEINMNAGQSFAAAKSIGLGSSDYFNIVLDDGAAQLKNTAQNDLLFPLPKVRPTQTGVAFDDISIQERYTVTTDGSGNSTTSTSVTSGTFENTGQWIVAPTDGAIESPTITLDGTQTSFTISGATPSKTLEIIAKVKRSSPTARSKTLTDATKTISWPADAKTDAAGQQYIDLDKTDIFSVSAVKINDSDGAAITSNWTLDNGQRDNYYGIGRLILKGGLSAPTSNIFIRFKHFTHGNGNFFDITSYNAAQVAYGDVPAYRQNDGTTIELRDVVDFRPVATRATGGIGLGYDSDGVGGTGIINLLPTNTDTFTGDIIYYMPRRDKLIAIAGPVRGKAIQAGSIQVITGTSDLNPQYPDVSTSSMALMNIDLNPYTLDESDLSTSMIPNKRFTMADIAELEQRIDKLQELTTLSLLELSTSSLGVFDSAGNARTKAGFLVDNFYDYAFSATDRAEYRASIDDLEGTITAEQDVHNVRLVYNSGAGDTTTSLVGDLAILPIASHQTLVNQQLATETMNVNPFAVITHNGQLRISPASDEWVETQYAPDAIVNATETRSGGTTRVQNSLAAWRNSWIGRPRGNQVTIRGRVTNRREIIADRVIDVQVIPFMRSRKISFKAEGLRPETQHFLFFNGVVLADYVRDETFERFSQRSDDVGNTYTNRTSHPDGASTIISDATGTITGSFIIPSNSALKFRTGTKIVKLLDISVDDDNAALSKATAGFTSSGVLETRQRTIRSTRVEERITLIQEPQDDGGGGGGGGGEGGGDAGDPLAQTFFINAKENPNGVFITKVDAYFASKDANIPVRCELRGVENGIPNSAPIAGAYVYLPPASVNIPADTENMASVQASPTTFEFEEPIYLLPDREYAVVLKAETIGYTSYVAETYAFILGSTEARVSRQPTLGSLFTSQNGFTWTPDQQRDLMFKLYRAEFSPSASAILENASAPTHLIRGNPISTTAGDATVRVYHRGHGLIKNDYVRLVNLDSDQSFGGIKGYDLTGSRQVTAVDYSGYTFEADSTASDTIITGGNGIIASQNYMFDVYVPNIQTLIPTETNISGSIKLTEGGSYAANRNTAIGYSRAKAASYSNITLNEFNFNTSPKCIFSDSNEAISPLSGAKSVTMKLNLSTNDTKVSPVIDLQRASMTMFENIIDKQDSAATNGFNVPISFVNETHPSEGSHAAKHVTVPVTLAEQAVGLKILFAAHRPLTGGFRVYYKTGTGDDNFDEVNWIELNEVSNNPADENPTIYREYEYLAGGQVGNLNAFSKFQLKIVMTSTNSSKIPVIKDLRAIALVT
jgi:hypothetical protein